MVTKWWAASNRNGRHHFGMVGDIKSEWWAPSPGMREVMRTHGFTNRELEMMFRDNPAKALELPVTPENLV
jgi:hypothetical protein